jgi:hypothetical protein
VDSTGRSESAARVGIIGTAIGIYAYADAIVLGPIVVFLAALTVPLIVFGVAAVLFFFVNLWMCNWIERQWDVWITTHQTRLEKRLAKLRKGRVMRHPVNWISNSSGWLFALAAALFNAVIVVALARLISGRPVGERRIFMAALGYSVFFAGLFSIIGFVGEEAIRAI